MGTWTYADVPDQTGKTFVITGSNSGIGLEAARVLAGRGAEVVLACRSQEKGQAAIESIRAEHPQAKLTLMKLDLASLKSVRAFAQVFLDRHDRLDALINNAGLMAIPQHKTEDGFEMQLGTNHLGHFALTGLLLGALERTRGARVVNVASQAHRMGRIQLDDLMFERRYDRWAAYGQSKLANLLFTFELQRRLEARHGERPPVEALACHPGYSSTELQTKGTTMGGSQVEGVFMKIGNALIGQSPKMGAAPTVRAAVDPEARGGEYYGPSSFFELFGAPKKVGTTSAAKDPETARKLWQRSVELTKVDFSGL